MNLYRWALIKRTKEYQEENWSKSSIFFAPHQDDETLGCGGTIARKIAAGASVAIVFMTDGSGSHAHLMSSKRLKEIRAKEAVEAAKVLGVDPARVLFLEFPDGQLSNFQEQGVEKVAEILQQYQPQEVFVPYHRDVIADHITTNKIAIAALQKIGLAATVYEYPIWFWRHFPWTGWGSSLKEALSVLKSSVYAGFGLGMLKDFQCRVSIDTVLSRKQEALAQHKSQMERLLSDCNWIILQDLVKGDFLNCFLQNYELFHRRSIKPRFAKSEVGNMKLEETIDS
ncbi:MAG: PIG-L family deacetylase [Pleurocapsa sp.]